jgi:hypothetical protein
VRGFHSTLYRAIKEPINRNSANPKYPRLLLKKSDRVIIDPIEQRRHCPADLEERDAPEK